MNIIYLIIETFMVYFSLHFIVKKKNIEGIYYWCSLAIILSNFMSIKTTEVSSMEISLGFVFFTSIITATNIMVQQKGPDEVKRLMFITIISSLISIIIIYLSTKLISPIIVDNNSYNYIFSMGLRPSLGQTLALLILPFDAILYHSLRKIKNKIPISNILSGIIINFITTIIFSVIAYVGTVTIEELSILIFIRYLITIIIHLLGTITIIQTNKLT